MNTSEIKNLREGSVLEELSAFAELEGTELGEFVQSLVALLGSSELSFATENFETALVDEILFHHEYFTENYEIAETTETYQYTHQELIQK